MPVSNAHSTIRLHGYTFGRHAKGWKKPKNYAAKRKIRRKMAKKSRQINAARKRERS